MDNKIKKIIFVSGILIFCAGVIIIFCTLINPFLFYIGSGVLIFGMVIYIIAGLLWYELLDEWLKKEGFDIKL